MHLCTHTQAQVWGETWDAHQRARGSHVPCAKKVLLSSFCRAATAGTCRHRKWRRKRRPRSWWMERWRKDEWGKEIGEGLPGCEESSRRTRTYSSVATAEAGEGFVCACTRVKMETTSSIKFIHLPGCRNFKSVSLHVYIAHDVTPSSASTRARRPNDAEQGKNGMALSSMNNTLVD